MISKYIERIDNAIKIAILNLDTKLTGTQFKLEGMSKRENRILLNEILKDGDRYLEIGVHKGSTFISALYKNDVKSAVAIDNFSQFGDKNVIKKWFEQNCQESEIKNYTLLEKHCFDLSDEDKELIRGTNVYFYDGDHTSKDQEMAISYYYEFLAKQFILIIDDYNHIPVKEGTQKGKEFLVSNGATIHKEWVLDNSVGDKSWHNALFIAIVEKP